MTATLTSKVEAVRSGLTIANFRNWIEKHPYQEDIGVSGDCTACPIAMFLIETFGVRGVTVATYAIEQGDESVIYFSDAKENVPAGTPAMPQWIIQFIDMSDAIELRVNAIEALNILDQIEKQEQEANQAALA